MTIYYPDVSHYQGFNLEPKTVAVCAKATEGYSYTDTRYSRWKSQAKSVGAVFWAYHFIHSANSDEVQHAYNVVQGVPLMIDAESTTEHITPSMIASFARAYRNLGGTVYAVYYPKWYWQSINSPDMTPIKNANLFLVSSNYVTKYSDNGPGWSPYGGLTPKIWQYTDKLKYSTGTCDFNAYKGTIDQFKRLINTGSEVVPVPTPKPSKEPKTTDPTTISVWDKPVFPRGDGTFEWAVTKLNRIEDKLDQIISKLSGQ
jgi:GH25 family lysozyme M1 (1,4-beta-N-acetylmuramidase)